MLFFVAERACHAAAAAGDDVNLSSREQFEGLYSLFRADQGLLVTMAMEPDFHRIGLKVIRGDASRCHFAHDELIEK